MKDSLIEIKNNSQENKSAVDEAKNQINDLEHKEAKKQPIRKQEEKRIQKIESGISSLWDNFKRSNIHIIGVPEGKEKEQKLEIYLKKMMKENFPNLVREIDLQVQEAQSPKKVGPKEDHTKTHHT